jgi:HD-GYP domain-containing protein (c-di-GMP phosphodiesterase class II)
MGEALEAVLAANDPAHPLNGERIRLEALARQTFPGPGGEPRPLLQPAELELLTLPEGNLNEAERREIESHVMYSTRFLETLPWPANLRRIPEIVALHHEKLDGSGYPAGLKASDIPLEARILSIADIFDALTAPDRPYRTSMPPGRALEKLTDEARRGAVDADLVAVFERSGAWKPR